MRVALFSRNARPADAIGRQVVAKWRYFKQLGAEVRLYVSEPQPLHPDLTEVVSLKARDLWRDPAQREFLRSCDLVLAEFGAAYDLIELLPSLAGRGPKIIVDYHGVTPPELADPALHGEIEAAYQQRALLWAADVVLVHSRFAGEELCSAIGLPATRLRHLPYPTTGGDCAGEADAQQLRQRHGLMDKTVLLFLGRLARNKQPGLLIQALEHLPASVHAVFVGPQDDVYASQKQECFRLARRLRVQDRVHFLGAADEAALDAWYRTADVLVLPSLHECFGLPVIEAMARGTPVIGADRAALPETVAHAGLTFQATSPEALAAQVRRYLQPAAVPKTNRIALVTHRFGTHFAGGAEASLRRMAGALRDRGYQIEVFTTCNDHESRWANTLPAGTSQEDGFTVHRFPIDPYDPDLLSRAYEAILRENGIVDREIEQQFLTNSLGSQTLLSALQARRTEFGAILTGPYLFKLTHDVVKQFREHALLAPCFHDEPLARLAVFRETYRAAGGLLFHSAAEARLTAERLAVNHPRHALVGTLLPDVAFQGDPARGRRLCGENYLVYCGRYCPEKGLDRLLRYMDEHAASGRETRLVCLGHGPMKLPRRPWLVDLGFVDEATKRDVIAGSLALVNLSPFESLSIVVLEAWALGVPVVVNRECAVLAEQIRRSEAGECVGSSQEFRETLDRWQEQRESRAALGQAGRDFVHREYASPERYAETLVQLVESLHQPLKDIARQRGLERAALFTEAAWQQHFAEAIKETLSATQPKQTSRVELLPVQEALSAAAGQASLLVTLRLKNTGESIIASRGPGRARLTTSVDGEATRQRVTLLPGPLVPGQEQLCVVRVDLPKVVGSYRLNITLTRNKRTLARRVLPLHLTRHPEVSMTASSSAVTPLVHTARQALTDARRLQNLPDDYVDVTEGKLAGLKHKLKRKLLNNFRKAYVDVAFRQQSALNRKLIAVMSLLLDTATVPAGDAALRQRVEQLERQLRRERRLRRQLQRQLDALTAPAVPTAGE